MTMLPSHFLLPGSHLLQSAPAASQVLPPVHGVMRANAVPSALHVTSVFPSQELLFGAHTESVHMPAVLLQSAAVSHSVFFVKPMPSFAHTSSVLSVQRCSWSGMHIAQVSA